MGTVEGLQADHAPADPDQRLCEPGQGACPVCVQQRPVHFFTRILEEIPASVRGMIRTERLLTEKQSALCPCW